MIPFCRTEALRQIIHIHKHILHIYNVCIFSVGNLLKGLPSNLAQMKSLKLIKLEGNPLIGPLRETYDGQALPVGCYLTCELTWNGRFTTIKCKPLHLPSVLKYHQTIALIHHYFSNTEHMLKKMFRFLANNIPEVDFKYFCEKFRVPAELIMTPENRR